MERFQSFQSICSCLTAILCGVVENTEHSRILECLGTFWELINQESVINYRECLEWNTF